MKYAESYVRLNWPQLNSEGISRPKNAEILINQEGCSFIKKSITCPYCLSMIIFMTCHQEINIFSAMDLFKNFFDDNRGNAFLFEMAFDRLFQANIITEVP